MKKVLVCISSLFMVGAVSVSGQGKLDAGATTFMRQASVVARTGKALKTINGSVKSDSRIAVLIEMAPGSDAEELRESGIEVSDVIGDVAVAYVTAADLRNLDSMGSVRRVQRARKKRKLNDTARQVSNVSQVHEGEELNSGYTGKGVIVGVVDGGFDPNHIEFKDAAGVNRVKKVWQYVVNEYTGKVSTYTYTGSEITSYNEDGNDVDDTHGTHVTGIAAGSYGFGETGTGAKQYYGAAPESEILMAGGDLTDDAILSGAKALISYAEAEGKPLVINMSLGDNVGPHDGTDAFTKALNTLAEDNIICVAAGNEADMDVTVSKTLTSSDKTVKTTLVPTEYLTEAGGSKYQASCMVEVWASDSRSFNVKVALVNKKTGAVAYSLSAGTSLKYLSSGSQYESGDVSNSTFTTYFPNSFVGMVKGLSTSNNRYMAQFQFELINNTSSKNAVYVPAIIVEGQEGQTISMYNDAYYNSFSTSNLSGYDKCTADGTISNMACGKHTIAVGAYGSRQNSWTSVGSISPFSSYGTLVDGRTLPHVSAPGLNIISAMSTAHYNSSSYSSYYYPVATSVTQGGTKYTWTYMDGTSMATPFMTGVAALWAQARPEITPAEVREVAMATAKAPSSPSIQWGAGKLDAYAGLKKVLGLSSVESVAADGSELMVKAQGNNVFELFMAGAEKMDATVYSLSGQVVAGASGMETVTLDASGVLPGIYLVKVDAGRNVATAKIVVK